VLHLRGNDVMFDLVAITLARSGWHDRDTQPSLRAVAEE
jgi:hypothetical protein